jgi:N-methylhydantoinase B
VSVERAAKDYGVVINELNEERCEYEIDWESTEEKREYIRDNRKEWLERDPEAVLEEFKSGEISDFDLIRRYGVIVDRSEPAVLENSTAQYREMLSERMVEHWD